MAKIQLTEYRCERCDHEWVPRAEESPRVCPKCKGPYWDVPKTSLPYAEFRAVIERVLQEAGKPITWTEVRQTASLSQKFPNNQWVHRMEADIGLVREKNKGGIILWSLRAKEST